MANPVEIFEAIHSPVLDAVLAARKQQGIMAVLQDKYRDDFTSEEDNAKLIEIINMFEKVAEKAEIFLEEKLNEKFNFEDGVIGFCVRT